jgi:hypothetical protein
VAEQHAGQSGRGRPRRRTVAGSPLRLSLIAGTCEHKRNQNHAIDAGYL